MRMQKYIIILHVPLKYEYHSYAEIDIEEYHEMDWYSICVSNELFSIIEFKHSDFQNEQIPFE